MKMNFLGRTGLSVSPLALGTVELGLDYGIPITGHFERPPVKAAIELVHAALDAGINLIDTARAYGESESVLGEALRGRWDEVVLATKVSTQAADGSTPAFAELRRSMLESLEQSLGALGVKSVDIWQIHNLDQTLLDRIEELAEIWDEVRRSGKVRWLGASTYGTKMPMAGLEKGLFDVIQITYSVLDQRLADRFLGAAREKNVGVMARSVLLQGVLTERGDHLPDRLEPLRQRSRSFRRLVADRWPEATPAQVAIAFALAQQEISSTLIGVRTREELEENLGALPIQIPADLHADLAALRLDDPDLLNPGTWWVEDSK